MICNAHDIRIMTELGSTSNLCNLLTNNLGNSVWDSCDPKLWRLISDILWNFNAATFGILLREYIDDYDYRNKKTN